MIIDVEVLFFLKYFFLYRVMTQSRFCRCVFGISVHALSSGYSVYVRVRTESYWLISSVVVSMLRRKRLTVLGEKSNLGL